MLHDILSQGYEELCRAALKATENAYYEYSGFAIRAAVLMNNGEVVCGSNQENAAYPSRLCAERTALLLTMGDDDTSVELAMKRTFSTTKV